MIHVVYDWLLVDGVIIGALVVLCAIGSIANRLRGQERQYDRKRHLPRRTPPPWSAPPQPFDIETARELDALEALWRQPSHGDVRPPS